MTSAATSSMWSRSSMSSAWVTSAIVATRRSGTALQPADLVRRVVVEVLLATDLVPVGLGELRVVRVPLRLGVHLGEDLTGREGDGVAVDVSPTADVHHLVEALTDLEGLRDGARHQDTVVGPVRVTGHDDALPVRERGADAFERRTSQDEGVPDRDPIEMGEVARERPGAVAVAADVAHLKRVTIGHPLVLGRTTFEGIGTP